MPTSRWTSVLRAVVAAVRPTARPGAETRRGAPRPRPAAPARAGTDRPADRPTSRPGGAVRPTWAPAADGSPDPGEVVWAWVPYEDDPAQGKDRPVLVLAREDRTLVALMLSSQDHDRDAAEEARHGRVWTDVGAGGWDPRRRPSEVRLDRVLRLRPDAVRREGAALDRDVFDRVARAAARLHGW